MRVGKGENEASKLKRKRPGGGDRGSCHEKRILHPLIKKKKKRRSVTLVGQKSTKVQENKGEKRTGASVGRDWGTKQGGKSSSKLGGPFETSIYRWGGKRIRKKSSLRPGRESSWEGVRGKEKRTYRKHLLKASPNNLD